MGSHISNGCVSLLSDTAHRNHAQANVGPHYRSVKTKIQQRALAGERYRGVAETLHRLIRGTVPLVRVYKVSH